MDLTVKNTGGRAGEEVVLVYISKGGETMEQKNSGTLEQWNDGTEVKPGLNPPLKEKTLVGFSRISLEAGETKTIPIDIDLMDMHQWDAANKCYFVEKGNYIMRIELSVGAGFMMQFSVE